VRSTALPPVEFGCGLLVLARGLHVGDPAWQIPERWWGTTERDRSSFGHELTPQRTISDRPSTPRRADGRRIKISTGTRETCSRRRRKQKLSAGQRYNV